jgi:hypothetical protein
MSWVAAAVVGSSVVGGYMSSRSQGRAADSASEAQMYASDRSIEAQDRALADLRKQLAPYSAAGEQGLRGQQDLLGLGAPGAQTDAIQKISQSDQFKALSQEGENAILQNASATGGLRGGNTQGALAQFRPQLLNQLIDQQYNRLGGLTSIGQNAAAGVGNAGISTGQGIGRSLDNIGAAQAGNALAHGRADAQMWGGISGSIGQLAGMGAFGRF